MKLTGLLSFGMTVLCGCLAYGNASDPPKLEIISAIYGQGPEAVDITEKVRKEVKCGTYLSIQNHPRFTGKVDSESSAFHGEGVQGPEGGQKSPDCL